MVKSLILPTVLMVLVGGSLLAFQNCSKISFPVAKLEATGTADGDVGTLGVCQNTSCTLTPVTTKPAVTTILMAIGEKANSQLVVSGASSQLIAETAVRSSSPVANPKILMVQDSNTQAENPEDSTYVQTVLLARYNTTVLKIPASGLKPSDVVGYDLVWFNNPGYPMGAAMTRDTLIAFAGGVVLQGDDLTQGANFDISALTGLKYIDNGTSVTCAGTAYPHDDDTGNQYRVSLDGAKFTGVSNSTLDMRYGNDIDNSVPARADLEILATAVGGPSVCTQTRPAIVRYLKP